MKKAKKYSFGASPNELGQFFCGIGVSEIRSHEIAISDYPFEPASVFPETVIPYSDVEEIHLDSYPITIKIQSELIFITKESLESLKLFAEKNSIRIAKRAANWQWITEPFLDTEFSEAEKQKSLQLLENNGISSFEVNKLRNQIAKQMYKYNFDTMLWEWGSLGLQDVLAAMRPGLSKPAFKDFYWEAMEVEQRC